MSVYKIKPLAWERDKVQKSWEARTLISYYITKSAEKGWDIYWQVDHVFDSDHHNERTLKEAKAWCESHWVERVTEFLSEVSK